MVELANFPMLSQRDSDINADYDCVAASIAACLQWLTGRQYTAGQVKDAVYGTSYVGGTAAFEYVDYCRDQGVDLEPVSGTGAELVTALHKIIGSRRPALVTEPDPYAAGWSHVCAAYKESDGSITVMDPWISAPVTKTDAQWANQLEDNQIWLMERIERSTWVNDSQASQAAATWASTTAGALGGGNVTDTLSNLFPAGKTPSYTTGIARSWQNEYMNGHNWGPPTSYEYSQVNGKPLTDWNGVPISQQNFTGGRCEWQNNVAHWYPWGV